VICLSSELIALTFARWALDRRPCFVFAAATRALPSGVRGPVLRPPCSLQRFRPPMAGFWQSVPRRVLAKHLVPGQPGPNRVAMPASISSAWLTLFTIRPHRSRGQTPVGFCQALPEGLNPVPWTVRHGPRLITPPGPRDRPRRRLSCHAFGAASVARSGSICRSRLRQPRPARPWPRPVSGVRGNVVHGQWTVHS